ncbi:response regulator [Paenibacillus sp.]|uniref:response regulator n=1 Tax=Paenibacillus sp. TaxID=58172 RepID=UPI002D53C139|nr:response regulator [Paenibacillus sp.]HZG87767.1 response regulator [Paenibacillus sp.]
MTYRILIADDEPIIRDGLVHFMDWESLQCRVAHVAEDGLQAKRAVDGEPIDIVVADIRMPGMSGIELAEYVQREHPGIKVVILTGFADFAYAQSAIRYGVIDFIVKTNPIPKLKEAIGRAIDRIEADRRLARQLREVRAAWFRDLLTGADADEADTARAAAELGVEPGPYRVLALETPEASDAARRLVDAFAEERHPRPIYALAVDRRRVAVVAPAASFEPEELEDRLREVLAPPRIGWNGEAVSLAGLRAACEEALASCGGASQANGWPEPASTHRGIQQLLRYIEAHYHEKLQLETLADHVHMNQSYLSRLFKKETGESLTDYINRFRIEKAKELIASGEYPVTEISAMVGFGDPGYFSLTFKKLTGQSPRDYKHGHS